MDRDRRRALESERLFEEQRARVSTFDAAGILGVAVFTATMFWDNRLVVGWAIVLLSQVIAGFLTSRVEGRLGRRFELWWVSGSSIAWAVLPLLAFDDARQVEAAWILTLILVFGAASDAVFLPQTYKSNVVLNSVAYTVPYLLVLGLHGMWPHMIVALGFLIHVGWGSMGVSGLVDDLISRRVDAVIAAERASLSARTDSLTGLLNRSGVTAELRHLAAEHDEVHCVFIDLDDFKSVNDQLGYEVGDRLLSRLASTLCAVFPDSWHVGRFGGDEFIAIGSDGDVEAMAEQLLAIRIAPEVGLLSRPGRYVHVSAGIASLSIDPAGAGDLIAHASAAVREAKVQGKNTVVTSDAAFRNELQQARVRASDLEAAIDNGEFVPFLQRIVDLGTGRTRGVEVLARWDRPDGMVFPDVFLPQVEAGGLQHALDRAMIQRGIEVLQSLKAMGRDDLTVSVNLSAGHLLRSDLPDTLGATLAEAEVSPDRLVLEVTESDELTDGAVPVRVAGELRRMGVGLSIDDFGTGYSSMTQLLSFPFTEMKLDRSLVDRVGAPEADDLLRALCDFGGRHGFQVVAEGIERADQHEAVRRLGVTVGQGWLFDRAAPASETLAAIADEPFGHGLAAA